MHIGQGGSLDYFLNGAGQLESRIALTSFKTEFENSDQLVVDMQKSYEFLDEPFEGIDAVASRQIRNLLKSYVARGGTIFLTSHILHIVETLCDQIGVIHNGRLVAQGSMTEMRHGTEDGRTLEQIFLDLVGADSDSTSSLDWLA